VEVFRSSPCTHPHSGLFFDRSVVGHCSPGYHPSLPFTMHLSEHSLRQLDEAYLRSLDLEALRSLSARLLADLKEARARLDAPSAARSRSPQCPAPSEYARNRAALAEVIDTCRQRGQDPWRALERAIADRRAGQPLAPLPQPGGVNDYLRLSGMREVI
jgi:hypothetical protein